ncbi:MAG: periplasmic heavy metal sensor, partial [Pseudomonadota bacterium]
RDTLAVQIDQKRLALAKILLQPKPDLAAIDTLLEDIAKLQTELEKKTMLHILEVKNQLAPEQQEQFIRPIVHELRRRCQHKGSVEIQK